MLLAIPNQIIRSSQTNPPSKRKGLRLESHQILVLTAKSIGAMFSRGYSLERMCNTRTCSRPGDTADSTSCHSLSTSKIQLLKAISVKKLQARPVSRAKNGETTPTTNTSHRTKSMRRRRNWWSRSNFSNRSYRARQSRSLSMTSCRQASVQKVRRLLRWTLSLLP